MKSKSFDSTHTSCIKKELDHNSSFDFKHLYKTAEETKASLQKLKNNNIPSRSEEPVTPKWGRSPNKRKKDKTPVEMTVVSIEGPSLAAGGAGCNTPREAVTVTSTPLPNKGKVKSIMKCGTLVTDDSMDGSRLEVVSTSKPKKRNKSVSFALDDNEQLSIKKSKSDDSHQPTAAQTKLKVNKKKNKKHGEAEKENKIIDSQKTNSENAKEKRYKNHKEKHTKKSATQAIVDSTTSSTEAETVLETSKKNKNKAKKMTIPETSEKTDKTQTKQHTDGKKKAKKKKHEPKTQTDTEEEPASKSRKQDIPAEVIADDLENLSIGDNAHTLSNLLDDMTVDENNKRKKLRKKASKKNPKDLESQNEKTVKEKWKRKRWNKEKKTKEAESLASAVIVDNLPISMLFTYKKILAEHFAKCGLLRNVGVAEVYPTEVSKPVFTTTVYFDTEEAATKALSEDGCSLDSSRIRVSRPLPPTQTTAVVRSYGALSEQALVSAFLGVGRLRNIRIPTKGKKAIGTAFLEFDGPEAVERAIKKESDIKIGGKKIHVSKFEIRSKKDAKPGEVASDADHSDDDDAHNSA